MQQTQGILTFEFDLSVPTRFHQFSLELVFGLWVLSCEVFFFFFFFFFNGILLAHQVMGRALARTRHAHHFDGQLPLLTGLTEMRWQAKIPKMTGSMPAKLKKCITLALIFQFPSNLWFVAAWWNKINTKIIFKNNQLIWNPGNLFGIQA